MARSAPVSGAATRDVAGASLNTDHVQQKKIPASSAAALKAGGQTRWNLLTDGQEPRSVFSPAARHPEIPAVKCFTFA
jgi:hypothetical protein